MNILVTGVAGLLGSKFAKWLYDNIEKVNVVGVDDLSGGYIEHVDNRINFHKLNLVSDIDDLEKLYNMHNFDYVFHFAAYAAEGLSPFLRRFNYQNNVIASINLINNSIKYNIKRFIFTSSMAVYGNNKIPYNEDLHPSPIDSYGIAKWAVEQDLKCAYKQHGLEYCIIRPHNVYGENQNIWDRYRNVLGIWTYQILNDKNPTIYGTGEQTRAFSYIDDCLLPLWNAAVLSECKNETINLGGIKEHSINQAFSIFSSVTKTNLKPIYLEKRYEIKNAWSTWEKSVKLLNFKHSIELNIGLEKMWLWALKQPDRKRFQWKNYELDKGIYSYWK